MYKQTLTIKMKDQNDYHHHNHSLVMMIMMMIMNKYINKEKSIVFVQFLLFCL